MIARTTALVFLSTVVATSMADVCPVTRPDATVACDFRNQDCRYGSDGCQEGFVYQCRCGTAGEPFVCSCRGDLGATTITNSNEPATDVESLEVESGAASLAAMASSVALLGGMVALF